MVPADEVEDGKITVNGSDLDSVAEGGAMPLAWSWTSAAARCRPTSSASSSVSSTACSTDVEGFMHTGQRDISSGAA